MQQQNENQQTPLDANSISGITRFASRPQDKVRIPLKKRLLLGGGLLLSSTILILAEFTRTLAGVAFLLTFVLNLGLLFYAIWCFRDGKQGSESRFIFWLGIAFLVLAFSSMAGIIFGLLTHWF
ncbi:MAG TPA: hypothetical protein VGD98_05995 [Ktedonobacteraceae bacterium]